MCNDGAKNAKNAKNLGGALKMTDMKMTDHQNVQA